MFYVLCLIVEVIRLLIDHYKKFVWDATMGHLLRYRQCPTLETYQLTEILLTEFRFTEID